MNENDLDKIFNDYENRKDTELELRKMADIKVNEMKIATKKVLDKVVIPLFEKTRNQLIERKHNSNVSIRSDSFLYPSVTLTFKPEVKNTTNVLQTEGSSLSFSQNLKGDIEIDMVIKGVKKSQTNSDSYTASYSDTFELKKITEELVEKKIYNFIKLSIEAY